MKDPSELILGITDIHGYTHDNSIALLKNGKILFAASEERYSRIKHDGSFPKKTIKAAIKYVNLKFSSIDTIVVGYPRRKILSLLSHQYFYEIFPFLFRILGSRNFRLIGDFINIIRLLLRKLKKNKWQILKGRKIIYIDHHLAHAASSYYTSGLEKCLCLVLDAFGSQESGKIRSGAVFLCQNGQIKELMSIPIFASLGMFYTSVTYSLGFKPGDGEGKTMGLAAYGNPEKLYKKLKSYSPTFQNGVWLPGKDWLSGILPTIPKIDYLFHSTRFGQVLNELIKKEGREQLAAAAQKILEEELLNLIKYLIKKYPDYSNICLAGGVFLNVKANKKIMELPPIKNVFIHPNAGDGGIALGSAFMATPKKYLTKMVNQPMMTCGLGESFTNKQVLEIFNKYQDKVIYKKISDIASYTVEQLTRNLVIGWFQGRAEWGPRALGFRSVLADPRKIEIKNRINKVLKNREWFMPFAPSILEDKGDAYFKNFRRSPFMTIIFDIIPKKAKLFPAAAHVDKTARPNTVNKDNNPIYHQLLQTWYKRTKLPILLNTSFNKHGLPIVNSPKDAIEHLIMGAVDELIIGNYSVICKK